MKNSFYYEKLIILLSIIFLIVSFYFSLNTFTHIFDSGHHGSILLNALDIIDKKIPYKEIFVQYGLLNPVINSFFLRFFNFDVIGIYFATSLFYYSGILFLALKTKKLTNYNGYILTVIVILFNHPIPEYPWPNYSAFFFLSLSIYIFDELNSKKIFLSSILLSLACLTRENCYYFVIPALIIINLFLYLKHKNLKKNIYSIFGFFIPLIIFFTYLILNDLLFKWIEFQTLPYEYLRSYDKSFFTLLYEFCFFFIFEVPFLIGTYPQYFPILLILIFNIYVLIEEIFLNKFNNINLIFISILSISSLIVSINLEIFRIYTSIIIGLPIFFYRLNVFNNNENKFIIIFLVSFISLVSIYTSPKGNTKFFKNINFEKSYNLEISKYFRNQKWEEDKWVFVKKFVEIDALIKEKCDINYILNLTPNAFVLVLSKLDRVQMSPLFNEHLGKEFNIMYQKDYHKIVNNKILVNDIYIVSMENNIKILNNDLQNYIIYKKLKIRGFKGSEMRVLIPNKCYNRINL